MAHPEQLEILAQLVQLDQVEQPVRVVQLEPLVVLEVLETPEIQVLMGQLVSRVQLEHLVILGQRVHLD